MITAVDTSVLLTIFNGEPAADYWLKKLIAARHDGPLIISEIVYAELAPAFKDAATLDQKLGALGIELIAVTKASAWQAGKVFQSYRKAGGPRQHLVPDFIIAAQAQIQADRLAAIDRGYLRKWFPGLSLLS